VDDLWPKKARESSRRSTNSETRDKPRETGKPLACLGFAWLSLHGAGGTRTHDLRFRKPSLYPAELQPPTGGARHRIMRVARRGMMERESRRGGRDRAASRPSGRRYGPG